MIQYNLFIVTLLVLIEVFGPVSGAHFNPVVTLTMVLLKRQPGSELLPYIVVQLAGAFFGAILVHQMFDMQLLQFSEKARTGWGIWTGEIVATAGLLLVILMAKAERVSGMVACYIGAAYWFTSSTSFANPAAAFGRQFSNSFAGIAPADAKRWRYLGYKGGSEPGVIAMNFLAQARDGDWYVLSASWNNPAARVDEPRFVALMTRALNLLAQHAPAR